MSIDQCPEEVRRDILQAIDVLKRLGARDVYLFGSVLSSKDPAAIGDIDIAVSGLEPSKFFAAYGALTMALDYPFDLVDLDNEAAFVQTLREKGHLERVA